MTNTGKPITAARLEELMEPFRRGARDRVANNGGVGLGLAIVTAVAQAAHGATVDVTPRPSGGIRAEVRFPVG